ncbi:hypothetical protein B0A48_14258 [Cryoendolithus antarcticus]|uniref:GTPase-activating protein GYP7 n=1 Tax=Cryoendolithus antarcticus TaxID=1507870 RepID=A0A1V8SLL6_9PEZI|nr:hypothetical protein B0A48_14258 [Cryoendolithus antarcticus]
MEVTPSALRDLPPAYAATPTSTTIRVNLRQSASLSDPPNTLHLSSRWARLLGTAVSREWLHSSGIRAYMLVPITPTMSFDDFDKAITQRFRDGAHGEPLRWLSWVYVLRGRWLGQGSKEERVLLDRSNWENAKVAMHSMLDVRLTHGLPTSSDMASASSNARPASPPSPSASFYALSDDEEGDYSTIRHAKSGKGVKLLYAKSKVYVHPSPSAKDNIAGYIAILEQKGPALADAARRRASAASSSSRTSKDATSSRSDSEGLLVAWLPESGMGEAKEIYAKVELADADEPRKQSYLVPPPPVTTTHSSSVGAYAFAVPLSEIYSIAFRVPNSGWWHGSIVINTRAGDSFPALFFHDPECQSTTNERKKLQRESFSISKDGGGVYWGGDAILTWLKRYAVIERSHMEPSVYLVDPNEEDKKAFLSGAKPTPEQLRNVLEGKHKDEPGQKKDGPDPVTKALREARWTVLEKLSQVTTFTRRTAQAVAENKNLPPQVRRLMQSPQVQTVSDEFDSARLYLARWAMSIAEQAEKEKSQRIWTAREILEMEESELGSFEILDTESLSMVDRRKPVTEKEWKGFFNSRTGRLEKTPDEVKERIFHGGLSKDDDVRKEAWLFLLGVYEWDSTADERNAKMRSLRDEYIRLKGAWWERLVDETGTLQEREWWKEQRMRIGKSSRLKLTMTLHLTHHTDHAVRAVEKDVHRTDRHIPLFAGEDIAHPDPDSPFAEAGTNVHLEQMKDLLLTYNEHNRDLGYVQGMSDLLAPIYAIEQDDAVAFWGFVGFMERMERNFLRDQSGMRLQLLTLDHLCRFLDPKLYDHLQKLDSTNFFFFFRMLLVWFKREFEFNDILRLWEGLWTDYYSANFHLFIAMAILEKHRDVILEHLKGFDEVLKYVNELSGTIDLQSTIVRAEALYRRFQRMVEAIDKKGNFPKVPAVRQRLPQPPPAGPALAAGKPSASASGRERTPQEGATSSEPVISPELRALLSREVPKLEKREVREHGGGVGS